MHVSKLLRFLLSRVFSLGIVDADGGGALVVDEAVGEGVGTELLDDDQGSAEAGAQGSEEAAAAAAVDGDDAELVVSIGDEPEAEADDPQRAPEWVRELRKSNREKDRRIRELEAKMAQAAPAPQAIVVGEKPTMESCNFDDERFERELEAWHTRKREADEQRRTREQAEEQQRAQWQARIDAVKAAASSLKVSDQEDAAQSFEDIFSVMQQGIVIGGPEDPKASALLRYALGKNPKKAKELAAIKDPVKFAFAVAKLETQLKVTPRKSAPPPDTPVRSAVAGAAAVDSQLARLQAEADRTGDRTLVAKYLRDKQRGKQTA